MQLEKYFKNRVVLLTGVGAGIGKEMALFLAPHVRALVLLDIRQDELQQVELQVGNLSRPDCQIFAYATDVMDGQAIEKIRDDLGSDFFPDIIIANAGLGGINPANAFSLAVDQLMMGVNYYGMLNTFLPFVNEMVQRKKGHLAGVSSLASLRGLPYASSYCSSKAAQTAILESWRNDLRPFGIKVSAFLPGFVKTPMAQHKEFQMPFMIDAKVCALKILNGIAGNKKIQLFPWPMKLLAILNRNLPAIIFDFLMMNINRGKHKNSPAIFHDPRKKSAKEQ